MDELTERVSKIEERISHQQDTTKLLNKIIEKIDRLEKDNRRDEGRTAAGQVGTTESKPSNYRGPLGRDRQRANQQRQ